MSERDESLEMALEDLAVAERRLALLEAFCDEWDARYGAFPGGFCHSLTIHEATGAVRFAVTAAPERLAAIEARHPRPPLQEPQPEEAAE